MPLYDYRCVSCGDFRELRPMAESSVARPCPACGALSERTIVAPFLAGGGVVGASAIRPGGQTGFGRACGHAHGCSHSLGH